MPAMMPGTRAVEVLAQRTVGLLSTIRQEKALKTENGTPSPLTRKPRSLPEERLNSASHQ